MRLSLSAVVIVSALVLLPAARADPLAIDTHAPYDSFATATDFGPEPAETADLFPVVDPLDLAAPYPSATPAAAFALDHAELALLPAFELSGQIATVYDGTPYTSAFLLDPESFSAYGEDNPIAPTPDSPHPKMYWIAALSTSSVAVGLALANSEPRPKRRRRRSSRPSSSGRRRSRRSTAAPHSLP